MNTKSNHKQEVQNVEVRQWFGPTRTDTLAGQVAALEVLRDQGSQVEVGPWEPSQVAALGFWARGEAHLLEAFSDALDALCSRRGVRVAAVDYAGAAT